MPRWREVLTSGRGLAGPQVSRPAKRRSALAAVLTLAGGALAAGCAWPAASGAGESGQGRAVITQLQIGETDAQNAYEAVQILRPVWLRNRGATSVTDPGPQYPSVAVDGVVVGDLDELRLLQASEVRLIRFLEPGPAGMKYGQNHVRGIIDVITNKG